VKNETQDIFRSIPSVNAVLEHETVADLIEAKGRETVLSWVREEVDNLRQELRSGKFDSTNSNPIDFVADRIGVRAKNHDRVQLGKVINATGVILHTGLGRAPMSSSVKSALAEMAEAGNVEIDLETNKRRYRGHQLLSAWQTLTHCEDALIVNNNAAATMLSLQALCEGKVVIISRGQLIEIGGSFRLPEVFELSGVKLKEIGTTNRTKLRDYENAIGPETGGILLVHPSNYRVIGFSETPGIAELAPLAKKHGLAMIDDIGSGSLVDVTKYGLPTEPSFQDSIAADADVVLGSGDKLLGGPQCGIILGKNKFVEKIRQHPLARAVRVGKLTLGALSATLDSYLRGEEEKEIPTVTMLATSADNLETRAKKICEELADIDSLKLSVHQDRTPVGGGSLPGADLPTAVISAKADRFTADELSRELRLGRIRVYGRIQENAVLLDMRSVFPDDDSRIVLALRLIAENDPIRQN